MYCRGSGVTTPVPWCVWVQVLFRLLDRDGDGTVNWRELVMAVGLQVTDVPVDDLFALAFEVFDDVRHLRAVVVASDRTRSCW